jgi:hypothetical protein
MCLRCSNPFPQAMQSRMPADRLKRFPGVVLLQPTPANSEGCARRREDTIASFRYRITGDR